MRLKIILLLDWIDDSIIGHRIRPLCHVIARSSWWGDTVIDYAPLTDEDIAHIEALAAIYDPPLPYPTRRKMIDLSRYLRGSGAVYRTTSGETMQTQRGDNGVFYHVKNANWEELAVTANTILRGLDTSPGGGMAYRLTSADGGLSVWCPRFMRVGQSFKRVAKITWYELSTGAVKRTETATTWLKLVAVHDTWTSYGGIALTDVVELAGAFSEGGQPFERYWYGGGLGLVGWQGGASMSVRMGISERPGSIAPPKRMAVSWYPGLKLPTPIADDDPRWLDYILRTPQTDQPSNLRSLHSKAGIILMQIAPNVDHAVQSIAAETVSDGEYRWYLVKVDGVIGWLREDVATLTPVEAAPPETPQEPPPLGEQERMVILHAVEGIQAAAQAMHSHMLVLEGFLEVLPSEDKS